MKGMGHGIILGSKCSTWNDKEKPQKSSVKVAGAPAEIRTTLFKI
jgi:hypothetical protein